MGFQDSRDRSKPWCAWFRSTQGCANQWLHTTRQGTSMNVSAAKAKLSESLTHRWVDKGKVQMLKKEEMGDSFNMPAASRTAHHSDCLQICTGSQPTTALLLSQLCIGKDCLASVFDGQFHVISAVLEEMLIDNLRSPGCSSFHRCRSQVPTVWGWTLPNGI